MKLDLIQNADPIILLGTLIGLEDIGEWEIDEDLMEELTLGIDELDDDLEDPRIIDIVNNYYDALAESEETTHGSTTTYLVQQFEQLLNFKPIIEQLRSKFEEYIDCPAYY